jgi:hypothetical protein
MYTIFFFFTKIIFFENKTVYFLLGTVHVGLTGFEQSQFDQLTLSHVKCFFPKTFLEDVGWSVVRSFVGQVYGFSVSLKIFDFDLSMDCRHVADSLSDRTELVFWRYSFCQNPFLSFLPCNVN